MLDSWIRIDADGSITVFTGKAELGQGIKTALIQIAAEELVVEPAPHRAHHRRHGAARRTKATPPAASRCRTAAPRSCNAAAQVRGILVELAAERSVIPRTGSRSQNGVIARRRPQRRLRRAGRRRGAARSRAAAIAAARSAQRAGVMGKPVPRVDIPAKVTGGELRAGPAAARHGACARRAAAELRRAPAHARYRSGREAAGRAQGRARRQLSRRHRRARISGGHGHARARRERPRGTSSATLPDRSTMSTTTSSACRRRTSSSTSAARRAARRRARSRRDYQRPYQMHASIGPSCAVGLSQDDALTVWTHTQGVYPLRDAIAEMLRHAARARALHPHGRLGLLRPQRRRRRRRRRGAARARACPGGRCACSGCASEEHAWEPYGSAMVSKARARARRERQHRRLAVRGVEQHALDAARARRATSLPAWHLAKPFAPPPPRPLPQPDGRRRSQRHPALQVCRTRASSTTSCPRCRCACRRCARSAPT